MTCFWGCRSAATCNIKALFATDYKHVSLEIIGEGSQTSRFPTQRPILPPTWNRHLLSQSRLACMCTKPGALTARWIDQIIKYSFGLLCSGRGRRRVEQRTGHSGRRQVSVSQRRLQFANSDPPGPGAFDHAARPWSGGSRRARSAV
jgi:hypothetical protein